MDERSGAGRRIAEEVTSWYGVAAGIGSRGELSFKVGKREIGHLHGDTVAHFSFGKELWRQLRRAGRISYHPVFPNNEGPAARRILDDEDEADVIRLLRLNYETAIGRMNHEAVRSASSADVPASVADRPHRDELVSRAILRAGVSPNGFL